MVMGFVLTRNAVVVFWVLFNFYDGLCWSLKQRPKMHKPPSKGINSYVAHVYVQRGRRREERPVILPIPTYPHICADQLWFGAASPQASQANGWDQNIFSRVKRQGTMLGT